MVVITVRDEEMLFAPFSAKGSNRKMLWRTIIGIVTPGNAELGRFVKDHRLRF
ncbi:hypothetical protein X753_32375 [Mesorhizobium sp. LNJC399B00]|nr:hypothetical protein X753_32375 [Mesorhizobium sp. LNJC399B00]